MVIDLFTQNKTACPADRETQDALQKISREMQKTENIFNYVTDSWQIEAAIYTLKALEASRRAIINRTKLENNSIEINI